MKTNQWAYTEEVQPNAEFRALLRQAAASHDLGLLATYAKRYGTYEVTAALEFDLSWPEEGAAAFRLFGEALEKIARLTALNESKHQLILELTHPGVVISRTPTDADDIPF